MSFHQTISMILYILGQLKNCIVKLEPFMEQSANGQIEVGLHFSHVASRLSIKLLSANKVFIYYTLHYNTKTRMINTYTIFIPCNNK